MDMLEFIFNFIYEEFVKENNNYAYDSDFKDFLEKIRIKLAKELKGKYPKVI